jgi:Zn-dependent membrane protease YugP
VLSITTLKTEKKAQVRANAILTEQGLITAEEAEKLKKLFHLYNVQYVNDIILSVLELIYNLLKLVAMFKGDSSKD